MADRKPLIIDAGQIGQIPDADTLTANQLKSTVAAGTPPLVVASDGLVVNLNADKVDGFDGGALASRTITGTANQINVANGDGVAGNPTLSTPQDIHTGAVVQFAGLGLGTPLGPQALLVHGDTTISSSIQTSTLRVNHDVSINQANGEAPFLQTYGTDSRAGQALLRCSANNQAAGLYMGKSRTATIDTTRTIVQSGDELGRIVFSADDGTDVNTRAVQIEAFVDGTPGVDDMPGRLVFATTADGGQMPIERMRITSGGFVGIGITPTSRLHVNGPDNSTVCAVRVNATQAGLTASDTFISFDSTEGSEGSISGTATAGLIAYNTFTGSHWSQSNTIQAKRVETLVLVERVELDSEGQPRSKEYKVLKVHWVSVLQPGAVLVSTDEKCSWPGEEVSHLPKCEVSIVPLDKRVYGVYGGHDKDGDILVLALGAGRILVCDEGGPIQHGDFLCASSIPGHAMRYDGNDMRVVVAKAREPFVGITGKICCTYLCG